MYIQGIWILKVEGTKTRKVKRDHIIKDLEYQNKEILRL